MIIKNKLKIDLVRRGVTPLLDAIQNDANARSVEISLLENGSEWTVPSGVSASVSYVKPDGTSGLYDRLPNGVSAVEISGSTIRFTMAPQMLTVPGLVRAVVVLIKDTEQLSTFPLDVHVAAQPGAGAKKSENYYYYTTFEALNNAIGLLKELKTEDKSSLVAAINEVAQKGGTGAGGGVTTAIRTALLNCFANTAWATENGQSCYDALREALYEDVVFVTGISLSKSAESVYTGYDTTVTATVMPSDATDKSIVWTSSDDSIATVEGSGNTVTVKGVADGVAVITATTVDGGYIDTFTITVATARVIGITLNNSTGDMTVGGTFELIATVTPVEAANKKITWTTSDDTVATVTASADTLTATVTATGEGSAIITATTNENGKTATFKVSVVEKELVEIVPTIVARPNSNVFYQSYYFDSYEAIDTSNKSAIGSTGAWRIILFDCTGVKKIRVKRYVNSTAWSAKPFLDACNQIPQFYPYLADVTTSPTTDVRYELCKLPANTNAVAGDVISIGDFELKDGYKYIALVGPRNFDSAGASTDPKDFQNESGYYVSTQATDHFKIFIVE